MRHVGDEPPLHPGELLELADLPLQAGRHLVERRGRAGPGRPRRAPASARSSRPEASRSAVRAACRTGATTWRVTTQATAPTSSTSTTPPKMNVRRTTSTISHLALAGCRRSTARTAAVRQPEIDRPPTAITGTVPAVERWRRTPVVCCSLRVPDDRLAQLGRDRARRRAPAELRSTSPPRPGSSSARSRMTYRVGGSAGPARCVDVSWILVSRSLRVGGDRALRRLACVSAKSSFDWRHDGPLPRGTMPSLIRVSSDCPTTRTTMRPSTTVAETTRSCSDRRQRPSDARPRSAPARAARAAPTGARRAGRSPGATRVAEVPTARSAVTRPGPPCSRRRGRSRRSRGARGRARSSIAAAARGR